MEDDRLPLLFGVLLRGQPVERHVLVEIRIAQVVRAVRVGAAHRFGQQVQVERRVVADPGEIESFQDVQHLNQHDAARAGRRHADDLVAAIAAAYRLALDRLVPRQVLERDDAAVVGHEIGDQPCGLAPVEAVLAVPLDAFQRPREIRLLPGVTGLVEGAVRFQEDLRRARVALPVAIQPLERIVQVPADRHAVPREVDRGLQQVLPGQGAQAPVRELQAGDGPRHADGENAVVVRVVADVAVLVEVHRAGGRQRRFLTEVEGRRLAVRPVVDEKAAAADVAGRRPGHRHGEGRSHRGVDRIAAFPQDVHADLRGDAGRRRDDAVGAARRMETRGGVTGLADKECDRQGDGNDGDYATNGQGSSPPIARCR